MLVLTFLADAPAHFKALWNPAPTHWVRSGYVLLGQILLSTWWHRFQISALKISNAISSSLIKSTIGNSGSSEDVLSADLHLMLWLCLSVE